LVYLSLFSCFHLQGVKWKSFAAFDGIAASPAFRSEKAAFPQKGPSCAIHFSLSGKIEYLFKIVKFSLRLVVSLGLAAGATLEGNNIIAGIAETKYK
jgi:hypothetical protein